MNKRNLGLLATLIGSAVGAWYLTRRRSNARARLIPAQERGTVIYDNTPVASAEGII